MAAALTASTSSTAEALIARQPRSLSLLPPDCRLLENIVNLRLHLLVREPGSKCALAPAEDGTAGRHSLKGINRVVREMPFSFL